MKDYIILAVMLIGLPLLYIVILQWQKPYFEFEQNRNRKFLLTVPEIVTVLFGECAVLKIWYEYHGDLLDGYLFGLLYTALVVMTILCMTDLWERIVPNRVLLIFLLFGFLETGFQAVKDIDVVIKMLPSMILGFLFCLISFGLVYLFSRGSLGSGDVKLSLLLGLILTGEYVVGTVFYGCLISALFSVFQLLRKKLTRKDEIPFVPFLYIGLIITYFVG